MLVQRLIFFAIVAGTSVLLTLLLAAVLVPGGLTVVKVLLLLCFLGVAPWLGICMANAVPGFLVRSLTRDPARAVLPVDGDITSGPITLRTVLAVTVRHEDVDAVLAPMRALRDALARYPDRFALFILSDTQDPALAAHEQAAAAADPNLRYRRRTTNTGFKAGNVMDFLDHHADGFDCALMLDADSQMSAPAVLRLVRIMQVDPRMGIVQHLTVGKPADATFPRLFQFGMRAGIRIWATGQAWWQGDEGPYWGHNALVRIAPFRAHARLKPLPDGSTILSHDQVEAALLRAAGWKVCIWADEAGSLEANPPALPEFLHRDARWLAGNLQYRQLLRLPGFRPLGRWQLVQAIMMFVGAPLYTAMLALAAINAATHGNETPRAGLLTFAAAWTVTIYAPKLLGYVEILLSRQRAAAYGGRAAFTAGATLEIAFSLLLDAISQPSKTLALTRLALGGKSGWLPQNRSARGVSWREASLLFWPHTIFGLAVFAALASSSTWAFLVTLPWAGGLLVAIPFCVWTSRPAVSVWLKRHGIAATPEEIENLYF